MRVYEINQKVTNGLMESKKIFTIGKENYVVLEELLNGVVHMTVTGKPYRGKGLPGIKQVLDRNQISNLHIITNDAYADVSKGIYKKIGNELSGTLIYWEINENSEVLPWVQLV